MRRLPRLLYVPWRLAEMSAQLFSRAVNSVFLGGSTRQTVSARAHVEWPRGRVWINLIFSPFQKDHCADAWLAEVADARKTLNRNNALETQ